MRKQYKIMTGKKCKYPPIPKSAGRYVSIETDGTYDFLIVAGTIDALVHELCHCIFIVFKLVGVKPGKSGAEPFCYLLSHLMSQAGVAGIPR